MSAYGPPPDPPDPPGYGGTTPPPPDQPHYDDGSLPPPPHGRRPNRWLSLAILLGLVALVLLIFLLLRADDIDPKNTGATTTATVYSPTTVVGPPGETATVTVTVSTTVAVTRIRYVPTDGPDTGGGSTAPPGPDLPLVVGGILVVVISTLPLGRAWRRRSVRHGGSRLR